MDLIHPSSPAHGHCRQQHCWWLAQSPLSPTPRPPKFPIASSSQIPRCFLADLIGAAASPRSSISRSYLAPPPRCSAPSSSRGWPAPLPPCRPARRAARRCSGVPSRRARGTSRRHRHLAVRLLSFPLLFSAAWRLGSQMFEQAVNRQKVTTCCRAFPFIRSSCLL